MGYYRGIGFWKRKNEGFVGRVREYEKPYYDPVANALNQVIGGVWNKRPLICYLLMNVQRLSKRMKTNLLNAAFGLFLLSFRQRRKGYLS